MVLLLLLILHLPNKQKEAQAEAGKRGDVLAFGLSSSLVVLLSTGRAHAIAPL